MDHALNDSNATKRTKERIRIVLCKLFLLLVVFKNCVHKVVYLYRYPHQAWFDPHLLECLCANKNTTTIELASLEDW